MPKVLLTKTQERQDRASRVLKICILEQHTDQRKLAKATGMSYSTLNKRINNPDTCTLRELWKILDALDASEENRIKILI
ncbi:helix-turn-helix domain-containing protein [Sellimonas caecigallum]|uniref:Helix-turn-helix domain-containing protein n=1 Tax=Sellimonas caecigallum TaxID=2592333 RepID=A0ABS7L713_9FIRM|nr:helix-turn-helix domain-containing protein [Sellimonas caecigallum]MBY0758555.1 helix-turn-helix domain-containing protein [Sellimonas caecigallum]